MSPEAAALYGAAIGTIGVGIGGILSFVGSLVVNERSQAAERKRLEIQFAESVKKERREAAHLARAQRLQPALDLLSSFERMVGVHLQTSAMDAWKDTWEKDFGPMDDDTRKQWKDIEFTSRAISAPELARVVGDYLPKIRAIPVPDIVTELEYLIAAATSMPSIPNMTTKQERAFIARMRSARDTIDSEIIRGNWP